MTDDRFLELAPLAALHALDGDDRTAFEAHLPACSACRAEVRSLEEISGRIALALTPVRPSSDLRRRVLHATGLPARPSHSWVLPGFAAAAALVLGVAFLTTRSQRDAARQEAEAARAAAAAVEARVRAAEAELTELRGHLEAEAAFRSLVADVGSRVSTLAGLKDAPQARARMIWNPSSREAVLLASGLAPTPPGKVYEVWVIAQAAPVPAGLFRVDAEGKAVFRLPFLEETAQAKTFAVTLEPEAGTPAPTGPMVLAGAAS